jgi:hypothetical protein
MEGKLTAHCFIIRKKDGFSFKVYEEKLFLSDIGDGVPPLTAHFLVLMTPTSTILFRQKCPIT